MQETLLMIVGLLLRIGLPIALTALVVLLLQRLDANWQSEALMPEVLAPTGTPCWEHKNCSPEKRAKCKAYQNSEIPCWQQFRKVDGTLREGCIGCDVFRKAPVPAPF